MSKKSKVILFISLAIVLVGIYFVMNALKHDAHEIEKMLDSIARYGNVIHIEDLNKGNAIAFYVSGPDNSHFGHALVKNSTFGWKYMGGSSSDYTDYSSDVKLGWSFHNLEHEKDINCKSLLYGIVIDNEITEVKVISEDGEEYLSEIIHDEGESFWYLLSESEVLDTATTIGLSVTREVIFEYPER